MIECLPNVMDTGKPVNFKININTSDIDHNIRWDTTCNFTNIGGSLSSPIINKFILGKNFLTLEKNFFLLDGKQSNKTYNNRQNDYLCSSDVSNENGTFNSTKIISLETLAFYEVKERKFKIIFDPETNTFPENFTVKVHYFKTYSSNTIKTFNITNNNNPYCVIDTNNSTDVIVKIEILINNINKPFTRLRVKALNFGVDFVLDVNNCTGMTIKKDASYMNQTINNETMTVDNINLGVLDINNPDGILNEFNPNNKAILSYELDGKTIIGGQMYLNTLPDISETKATFKFGGLIQSLTNNIGMLDEFSYEPPITYENNMYVFTFKQILTWYLTLVYDNLKADNINWGNTPSLNFKTLYPPSSHLPANEVLQMACNACGVYLYESVNINDDKIIGDKIITIKNRPNNTNIHITLNHMLKYPEAIPLTKTKTLSIPYYNYSLDTQLSTLTTVKKSDYVPSGYWYTIKKVPLSRMERQANAETRVTGIWDTIMVEHTEMDMPFRDVEVKGWLLKNTTIPNSYPINDEGETLTIDNPFISSKQIADNLHNYLKPYVTNNIKYKVQYVGNPCIEPNDIIYIDDKYSKRIKCIVLETKYSPTELGGNELICKKITI